MNSRWIPLLLLAIVWAPAANADEFRTPSCHITFPGKHVTAQERSPVGWVITELQEEEKGTYALSGFSLPIQQALPPEALEKIINSSRAEAIARKGYVLVRDEKRKLDDRNPGLDLVLEKKQAGGETLRIRMRIYFVGNKVYQIMVSGAKEWTESEEATKFLDSFGING